MIGTDLGRHDSRPEFLDSHVLAVAVGVLAVPEGSSIVQLE